MRAGARHRVEVMVDRVSTGGKSTGGESTAGESAVGESVRIVVNGEPREVVRGQPLPALLDEFGLRVGMVVVEHNGSALTASEARAVRLRDGDVLELVRAVAGG
jgi:sulfur carrier protein